MPFVDNINISSLSGNDAEEMIRSVVRQLNEWAAEISNEKIASVQKGQDGNVRIVQGLQTVNGQTLVGTLYYDNDGVDRILVGLHPIDGRAGIWVSEEGESVIDLLAS